MNASSRAHDRFWLYVLICFIAFGGLTYVDQAKIPAKSGWREPIRDLALGFFPLGVTVVFWEFWLRKARQEEIREYLKREFTDVLSTRFAEVDAIENDGLIKIRRTVNNEELRDFIATAQHRLFVLVPWFVEPTILEDTIRQKAAIPGFRMQIVLLTPNSPYLKRRGEVVMPNSNDYGKNEAKKTLLVLRNALQGTNSNEITIRVYDSLPSVFLVQADEKALLGLHLNTGTALKHPHFEIRIADNGRKTTLGNMIEKEFTAVTNDNFSRQVDLRSVNGEGEI